MPLGRGPCGWTATGLGTLRASWHSSLGAVTVRGVELCTVRGLRDFPVTCTSRTPGPRAFFRSCMACASAGRPSRLAVRKPTVEMSTCVPGTRPWCTLRVRWRTTVTSTASAVVGVPRRGPGLLSAALERQGPEMICRKVRMWFLAWKVILEISIDARDRRPSTTLSRIDVSRS